MNTSKKYEFVIVGSGAGGATVARELTKRGRQVLVIEKGVPQKSVGSFLNSARYYDVHKYTKMPLKSKEGVILWHSFMAGGSTVVSCGNGVPCLQAELKDLGIDLDSELSQVTEEITITPYDERRLSPGSKRLLEASRELGYNFEPMPKFIDPKKCRRCSNCQLGCKYDAKWTARSFLDEAVANGAEVLYKTDVEKVLIRNGKVTGISVKGIDGYREISAGVVVLAAGGFNTPVILQNSGLADAGTGFFMDLLVNTYGVHKKVGQIKEPTMALVNHDFHKDRGFILSPFLNSSPGVRFFELGIKGFFMPSGRILGFMTKIADESSGRIYPDGTFTKTVTPRDRQRLDEGSAISKEILIKAGVDEKSVVVTRVQGGHPGGTSAIGRGVDKDLQTEIDSLFVCDSSVLPVAPGLPPILTIVALGKRLATMLAA